MIYNDKESQIFDNGKGFRFVTLWLEDSYDRRDKFTFILSKGTVLVREHVEFSFGFNMHGDLLLMRGDRGNSKSLPMMNCSGYYEREISGWYIPALNPMVVELKKILAEEAIYQVVLGGT